MKERHKISIEFPLKGEWQFLRPPGHHPYAFDFVKLDKGRKKYHKKSRLNLLLKGVNCEEYYCFNQPVYSPVEGTVIRVGNDWPDHLRCNIWKTVAIWYNATYKFRPQEIDGKLDIRPNAGNYVMIQTKEDYIVFLAHLRLGSVRVNEGEKVEIGQEIGNVGNSGNSTAPHLHINLFDQMDRPLEAKVLSFSFKNYYELQTGNWIKKEDGIPTIKSLIKVDQTSANKK